MIKEKKKGLLDKYFKIVIPLFEKLEALHKEGILNKTDYEDNFYALRRNFIGGGYQLAARFKSKAFREEKEVRLAMTSMSTQSEHINGEITAGRQPFFRTSNNILIPYMKAERRKLKLSQIRGKSADEKRKVFGNTDTQKMKVLDVMIGPNPNFDLARNSLKKYCNTVGHPKLRIKSSKIPYRPG